MSGGHAERPPTTFGGSFRKVMGHEFIESAHEHGGIGQHFAHLLFNVVNPAVFPIWLVNRVSLARRKAAWARDIEHYDALLKAHGENHWVNNVPEKLFIGLEKSAFNSPGQGRSYANVLTILENQAKMNIGLQRKLDDAIKETKDAAKKAVLESRLQQVVALEGPMNARRTLVNEFVALRREWLKELEKHGHVGDKLLAEEARLRHEAEELEPVLKNLQQQILGLEKEYLGPTKK